MDADVKARGQNLLHLIDTASSLLDRLDVQRLDTDLYLGRQPNTDLQRVFGGQVAAQSLVSGASTVDGDYEVHSLHSYFLRPGDYSVPIIYNVERLRDGRSFRTRRVTAQQHGKPIYTQLLSFHSPEDGYTHQSSMPDVAGPQSGQPFADVLQRRGNPMAKAWAQEWASLDVRWLEDSRDGLENHPEHPSMVRLWMKVIEDLPDDPTIHAAAFTYASDISLLGSTLIRHAPAPGAVYAASLDHSLWFHRPFRSDDWWLYDQVSPAAQGARGFARGSIFTPDGTLVASVAQEVLIRPAEQNETRRRNDDDGGTS